MKATLEVARTFLILFVRDRLNLFFAFFFNALLLVMLGLSIEDRYNVQVKIGVADLARSAQSRRLTSALRSEKNLRVVERDSEKGVVRAVEDGDLVAAVVIEGEPLRIRVLGDPSREMWVRLLMPGLRLAVMDSARPAGAGAATTSITSAPVKSRNLRYFDFIFPGVVAFSVMQLGLFGGLGLLYFKAGDTLKRLKLTPLSRAQFLMGYTASRLVILIAEMALYVAIGTVLFRYRFQGEQVQVACIVALGGLLFTFLGIAMSALMRSPSAANSLLRFVNFPAAFLCGVFFPRESMPRYLADLALLSPLTYMVDALRGAANYGVSLQANALNLGVLAALLVITAVLAVKTFRWEEQAA